MDADETYVMMELFFIAWMALSVLVTVFMWFMDYRRSNYLFINNAQRSIYETTPEYLKMMDMEMPSAGSNDKTL